MKTILITLLFTVLASGYVVAASKDDHSSHSGHSSYTIDHSQDVKKSKNKGPMNKLDSVPESGKAREAGSDSSYMMETTTIKDNLSDLCAKASRGLIMLDNKTWDKCGGKSKGIPAETGKSQQQTDHSGH